MRHKLMPVEPPGRATRKARQFDAEIARLRAEGYTLAAIRRALAAAGVDVSLATIRRELSRPVRALPTKVASAPPAVASARLFIGGKSPPSVSPAANPSPQPGAVMAADPPSGKDLAEAFSRSQISHPLLRAKETP